MEFLWQKLQHLTTGAVSGKEECASNSRQSYIRDTIGTPPIVTLPREILNMIVTYIPIEGNQLQMLALSSHVLFGVSLTSDVRHALRHLRLQLQLDRDSPTSLMDSFNAKSVWSALPLAYKAAVYALLLETDKIWSMTNCAVSDHTATRIYTLLSTVPSFNLRVNRDLALRWASGFGHLQTATLLLSLGCDPSARSNDAIQWACTNGHLLLVNLLIQDPRVDPGADHQYGLRLAATLGHTDIVQLLLMDRRVLPQVDRNNTIRSAATFGHVEIVHILLADPRVDPADMESKALWSAAEEGRAAVVGLLLADGRADPTALNSHALRMSAKNGHTEVVRLLLVDGRADPSADTFFAIKAAYNGNHGEVLRLLGADPRVDPRIKSEYSPSLWGRMMALGSLA
ncbi:hypothetical protein HDU81_001957 [Chytriomyces hyalinus]|nr:hypothetical protein HDU81_001957 [Chytriomyces hyalinus]